MSARLWVRWLAGLALLLALPHCADIRAAEDADGGGGGAEQDGGPAALDAGTLADAAMDPSDPPPEYDTSRDDGLAAAAACFDGDDNDDNDRSDCDDASCQANVPACCVGTFSDACCVPGPPTALPFADCEGRLSACPEVADTFDVFGDTTPRRELIGLEAEPTFLPGGSEDDGGVLFPERLDPRRGAIHLTAQVASSTSPPRSGALDALAFGVVDGGVDASSLVRVSPAAAFVVSRNRQEASLVVAGETVDRWPLIDDGFHRYDLVIEPGGVVRFRADEGDWIASEAVVSLDGELRAVAYGRTSNPGGPSAPAPVRARSLTVTRSACDAPAALTRAPEAILPASDDAWGDAHPFVGRPHAIRHPDGAGGERVRVALVVDGAIHLAEPDGEGLMLSTSFGEPALPAPGEAWATDGVDAPKLRWTGDGLELWLTGWADGVGTIARATWDEGTERFGSPDVVLRPSDPVESLDHAAPFEVDGQLHLVVRERRADGTALALYRSAAGEWVRVTEVARASGELFAFDRDEVASPAVLIDGGVYRIYYAGRRGTRWSIGLAASHDGARWERPLGGPVLRPSGDGFDAIGVRDPAPLRVGDELRLYYAGSDGARTRIGVATGPASPR